MISRQMDVDYLIFDLLEKQEVYLLNIIEGENSLSTHETNEI